MHGDVQINSGSRVLCVPYITPMHFETIGLAPSIRQNGFSWALGSCTSSAGQHVSCASLQKNCAEVRKLTIILLVVFVLLLCFFVVTFGLFSMRSHVPCLILLLFLDAAVRFTERGDQKVERDSSIANKPTRPSTGADLDKLM